MEPLFYWPWACSCLLYTGKMKSCWKCVVLPGICNCLATSKWMRKFCSLPRGHRVMGRLVSGQQRPQPLVQSCRGNESFQPYLKVAGQWLGGGRLLICSEHNFIIWGRGTCMLSRGLGVYGVNTACPPHTLLSYWFVDLTHYFNISNSLLGSIMQKTPMI